MILQKRPKPRGWMHRMISPEDLMLQLVSLQSRRTRQERSGESSDVRRSLLQMLLTFDANSDGSSADGDEDTTTGAEECST